MSEAKVSTIGIRQELTTEELISSFEQGTLPKEDWGHKIHLKVALWYIFNSPNKWTAYSRLRGGILFHNISLYGHEKGSGMYHETITNFLFTEIYDFYEMYRGELDFNEILSLLVRTENFFDKDRINNYFSKARLSSPAAKTVAMEPDLCTPRN